MKQIEMSNSNHYDHIMSRNAIYFQQVQTSCSEAQQDSGRVLLNHSTESTDGHSIGPILIELPAKYAAHPERYTQQELFAPYFTLFPHEHMIKL